MAQIEERGTKFDRSRRHTAIDAVSPPSCQVTARRPTWLINADYSAPAVRADGGRCLVGEGVRALDLSSSAGLAGFDIGHSELPR